ncbi:MAG: FAD-dependent oxidoreductase [Candidatus Zipacnadales bacterium]
MLIAHAGGSAPSQALRRDYDVVVLGATPGGIMAAVAAARAGRTVGIFEPSAHIGGVVAGGLTASDYGDRRTIGGLAHEFFARVAEYYRNKYGSTSPQARACNLGYWFEPHVAEMIFGEMLNQSGRIECFTLHPLIDVECADQRIRRVQLRDEANGKDFWVSGLVFIDALYEGDLMTHVAEYRIGREGAHEFDEPHAGVRPDEPEPVGQADFRTQAYNYRVCLTDDPQNRLPISKPESYRREDYLTIESYLRSFPEATFARQCVSIVRLPNGKADTNNGPAWQSTDLPEANYAYWQVTYDHRRAIADVHRRYILGLLYFLQNDTAVPENIRAEASAWGIAADEFPDNAGWPYALYVRECVRMIGKYIFTEHDATTNNYKPDSIGLGSYWIDSHFVRKVPQPDGTWRGAGELFLRVNPYEIPYGITVPERCKNLLVPVCVSATHVGYCTLRMEPVYMILGHACGEAAAMACETGAAVQDIDVTELQRRLTEAGQIIHANRPPKADFRVMAEQPLQAGETIRFQDLSTDEDNRIVEWEWDFDGDYLIDSQDPNPSFTFTHTREYEVTLRVRDDYGDRSLLAKQVVTVVGGPPGVADIVVDDEAVEALEGTWFFSNSNPGFVGDGYHHDGDRDKGRSSARYALPVKVSGIYEVMVSYPPHPNRATNVPVHIHFAGGNTTHYVNQREKPTTPPFQVIAQYPFTPETQAHVEITNSGTDGFVVIDAVRLRYVGPIP